MSLSELNQVTFLVALIRAVMWVVVQEIPQHKVVFKLKGGVKGKRRDKFWAAHFEWLHHFSVIFFLCHRYRSDFEFLARWSHP